MITPEQRLFEAGRALPAPMTGPPGVALPFTFVNIRGDRAFISGTPRQDATGTVTGPYGVLGSDFTTEEGYVIASDIALGALANLKAEIGELSRVTGWARVFGMVNSAQGYSEQHLVVNGFSDTVLTAFGPQVGRHARSAIGTHGLPLGFAVEIEAEVLITP